MALITLTDLTIGFRGPLLLDHVCCQIEAGQRIGLLGRNGAGKTTLMRLLSGELRSDSGKIDFSAGTKVSLLSQDVPRDVTGSIREIVEQGLPEGIDHGESDWQSQQRVENLLSRMELDPDTNFEVLSSGMKRRALLAKALVSSPELLLLDEPTNHLDIESIAWLEDFLMRWPTTLIFVTHDRMFLRKLADRIFEIDRGRLFDWSCDYETFLNRKEAALAAEDKQNALFDKRLAEEEVWIRQGIKARRTRNEGRVRSLEAMREMRRDRRESSSKVQMQIQQGQRSGNLVADIDDVSFSYGDHPIVHNFSTTIMRGDKVGIIGSNGVGKTTLLRILLGELAPTSGSVRLGTNLQIAYFDQLRQQLHEEQTVQENVGDGYETIQVNGSSRHIIGYLQDFLFSPERTRTPVRFLSGGERNRVLLAKLFAKPANIIVLDEPTNDLDSETLELLEELLAQFKGTVLLVSHDRMFLNNVVTSTIVLDSNGAEEFVGGYDDWQRQLAERQASGETTTQTSKKSKSIAVKSPNTKPFSPQRRARLTFKEQQELTALPAAIEKLESELTSLHQIMAQADFYQQPGSQIAEKQACLKGLEERLTVAFARWEELESRSD